MSEKCQYVCELFVIPPPKSPFSAQVSNPVTRPDRQKFQQDTARNHSEISPKSTTENLRNLTAYSLSSHCKSQTLPYTKNPCNIIYYRDLSEYVKYLYLLSAVATSTAQATVHPTIGLLPIPRKPIISTCAGTDEEPANCASECIRPMVSVIP